MARRALLFLLLLTAPSTGSGQTYHAVLFNGSSASQETRLLAMTLAGIVNRDSARLYLLNVYETWSYSRTDEQWRDLYRQRGGAVFDSINSIVTLVERFRPFIAGGISYDPAQTFSNFSGQLFRWQGEYAALIGGLTNRLPVSPTLATALGLQLDDSVVVQDGFDGDPDVVVPGRLESSDLPWNKPGDSSEKRYLTMLDWGVATLLPRCNPRKFYLREITDFAVRHKMFQANLAGTDDLDLNSMPVPRADVLERILLFMQAKNPDRIFHMYGWIRPEPMTQWFAFFGASFHETLLGNLSFHSSFPVAAAPYRLPAREVVDTAQVRDRHYILFVGSEGDASNWHFGFQSGAWLSPERGSVPIGWGWNLHLFDECPFVARYYYDTATPNDGFLSVTTPLGYAYPDLWGDAVLTAAAAESRHLFSTFDVHEVYGYKHYAGAGTMTYRGKTINNSFDFQRYGAFQSDIGALVTIVYDPLIGSQRPVTSYGPLMWNHTGDGSFYGAALDLNAMATRILGNLRSKPRPGFLLAGYQRFRQEDFASRPAPGDADVSIGRLKQVITLIKADTSTGRFVEVVTPQTFAALLRKTLGLMPVIGETGPGPEFVLEQNYPNPFNPTTEIRYQVSGVSDVKLSVFDVLGREVRVLVDETKAPGRYEAVFDGRGRASGVYFYRLEVCPPGESNPRTAVRRAILVK